MHTCEDRQVLGGFPLSKDTPAPNVPMAISTGAHRCPWMPMGTHWCLWAPTRLPLQDTAPCLKKAPLQVEEPGHRTFQSLGPSLMAVPLAMGRSFLNPVPPALSNHSPTHLGAMGLLLQETCHLRHVLPQDACRWFDFSNPRDCPQATLLCVAPSTPGLERCCQGVGSGSSAFPTRRERRGSAHTTAHHSEIHGQTLCTHRDGGLSAQDTFPP